MPKRAAACSLAPPEEGAGVDGPGAKGKGKKAAAGAVAPPSKKGNTNLRKLEKLMKRFQ